MIGTVEQGSQVSDLSSFHLILSVVKLSKMGLREQFGTGGSLTIQSVVSSTELPGRFHRASFPRPMPSLPTQNSRSQCRVCMLSYCDTHQDLNNDFTEDQKLMPDDISKYGASPSAFIRTMHCSHWESLSFLLYEACCRALSQPEQRMVIFSSHVLHVFLSAKFFLQFKTQQLQKKIKITVLACHPEDVRRGWY